MKIAYQKVSAPAESFPSNVAKGCVEDEASHSGVGPKIPKAVRRLCRSSLFIREAALVADKRSSNMDFMPSITGVNVEKPSATARTITELKSPGQRSQDLVKQQTEEDARIQQKVFKAINQNPLIRRKDKAPFS